MMSRRPAYRTEDSDFYRCAICGSVIIKNRPTGVKTCSYEEAGVCCGHRLTRLEARVPDEAHAMRFCIFGGFEHNTIRVEVQEGWHPMTSEHSIEWMYLRTFQGGQLKYLPQRGESAALFAMAGEDAFAFCDREVCRMGWEHCAFQCKQGHIAYAYCSQHGLYKLQF